METALSVCRELTKEVIECLRVLYPDTKCTLTYGDTWQLLISARLAVQCMGLRVGQVTPRLYERFPTVRTLSKASVEDIEEVVRPCGFGNSEAWNIRKYMMVPHEEYQDQMPCDFRALLAPSGVGRKSASLIVGSIFGEPAIVTNTHCIRLVNRIGLVDQVREPARAGKLLWELVLPEEGDQFCHRLVDHGRAVCTAQKPGCGYCVLNDLCRYAKEEQPFELGEL